MITLLPSRKATMANIRQMSNPEAGLYITLFLDWIQNLNFRIRCLHLLLVPLSGGQPAAPLKRKARSSRFLVSP